MKLITITPMSGGRCDVRVYETDHSAASGQIKSSAVTNPLVSSLILRTCTADGARLPLRYRLMEAGVTPIALAKAACDMLCSERKSDSFMSPHYHEGNACQATITELVIQGSVESRYHRRMGTALDGFLINLFQMHGTSAAEVARRAGTTPNKISNWRKGKGSMPDKQAIAISALLGVTPFDIKPDFNKVVLDGIPDPDEREEARLVLKRAYKNKVAKLAAPIQAAPNHAPPPAEAHPAKDGRRKANNRTK